MSYRRNIIVANRIATYRIAVSNVFSTTEEKTMNIR